MMAFPASKGYVRETGRGKHGVKMVGATRIPIPAHPGNMPTGTARKILAQAGYSINDVIEWRR
ncbi:MAG: type II toxin-antitoxin system HicA family toxin [Synergistaceae bacterium]|nr:type II toxin-antitoxin system HicA family toxin [Synergistaceae bacterium]